MADMKRELMGIYAIWLREFRRMYRDKAGFLSSVARPVIWLLIMGVGLGSSMTFSGAGIDYLPFIAPGIVAMSVLFTSLFSGVSVIWDREFGFLKEMLVAPISRKSIIVGKALGGSTWSIMQSVIIIAISFAIGVQFLPTVVLTILPIIILVSVGFVSIGIAIASMMDTMEGFSAIMNFIVMPMFLMSGALFPINNLPSYVSWIMYINPMTYGVELMRYACIGVSSFNPLISLGVVAAFTSASVVLASVLFSRKK